MEYSRSPTQHTGKVAHAGHAPPKFRSPTNTSSTLSMSNLSYMRRPLPPAPRNKDSSDGLSGPEGTNVIALLRNFEHHIPLKHDSKYIYAAANPSSPNVVYFFEYRGRGAPPPGIGALGDVYLDLTQNSFSLYAKSGVGWVRWTLPGWLEHPFLTDTILSLSQEGVNWDHPTMVEKYSDDGDIHVAILDMLGQEEEEAHQVSPKQSETNGRDDSDAAAVANIPRKRPRVDEELAASPPPSAQRTDGDPRRVSSAPADHSASSYRPYKRTMDSRISGLQEEMTKIQGDLHELQVKNARVTLKNEELEEEAEVLRDINEKLRRELDGRDGSKGKTADAARTPDALIAAGATGQPGPNGAISASADPQHKEALGRLAQRSNRSSDMHVQKLGRLPTVVQNRLEGHVNHLSSIMEEFFDAHHRLEGMGKTVADQKLLIDTLSAEVQRHQDARERMEKEHKEQQERLLAINAWLMGAPKIEQGGTRTGG